MVKYEIQRLASNTYGAIMACVGQTSIHSWQEPQYPLLGDEIGRTRSV